MKIQARVIAEQPVTIQPFDSLIVTTTYDREAGQYRTTVFLHGKILAHGSKER